MKASEPRQDWRRSSFCGTNACVEVAQTDDAYLVRDSKNPTGPVLHFTLPEWEAFIAGVNAGEFSAADR